MKIISGIVITMVLCGCAARSTVKLSPYPEKTYASHTGPVCMLKSPLPVGVTATTIGLIDSSKRTYGSVNELLPLMAADARRIGADAIVSMDTGQKFGLLAWSRPVGKGTAVKLDDPQSINCVALGGEYR
jgi:hypothetical protein